MQTLLIRKAGGRTKRVLGFGGPGQWVVASGETQLASARDRVGTSRRLEIEIDGRRLTADMPGMLKSAPEREFTVTDDATGERAVDGRRVTSGEGDPPVREKWAVRFASGTELAWMYKIDPYEMGFYDAAGNAVMVIGHNVPFDASSGGSTLRLLFRLWGAAVKSEDEYAALFDERAIGPVVSTRDLPLLALVGMWMQRRWDIKGRGGDMGFG